MAEKILNTRIQLKYDTWDNWQKTDVANKGGNLVLKQGEMAVTAIASGKSDFTTPPTIMFKVGDGTTAFKDLPWASGLAADVYPWAKAPSAPAIGNGKITIMQGTAEKGSFTVNQTGDATITLDSDTDTDTQYQLAISGHTLKLQSKAKGATTWTDISGQSFTLPDNNTTYTFSSSATSGASFKVKPSNDTEKTVYIDGLGTAAYEAKTAFATAAQGNKADTAIQSVKTLNTNNTTAQTANASEAIDGSGTINLHKVSKTGNYNDLLNKPTIPTIPTIGNGALTIKVGKDGDTSGTGSFTANQSSASTITLPVYTKEEIYTKTEVDGMIVGAVQYLGTVANATQLAALNPDSVGDFCRVSTAFGSYHVGDLLLCKTLKTSSAAATWDVIHGEIDKDTWTANSKTAAGYVAAGGSNANKVWKTDANGNPGWRDDANTDHNQKVKAKNSSGTDVTFGADDVVEIAAGSNVTITPDATNKKITIASSYTDTNTAHSHTKGVGLVVTGSGGTSGSVEYKAALASEALDTNAAVSRPAANANRTYPVIVDKNGKLATIVPWTDTNTDTDTNQKVKTKDVTFDANDTVEMKAGTGLKVTASNATAGSEYIQYDIDDTVVFVLNGGSSTEVI